MKITCTKRLCRKNCLPLALNKIKYPNLLKSLLKYRTKIVILGIFSKVALNILENWGYYIMSYHFLFWKKKKNTKNEKFPLNLNLKEFFVMHVRNLKQVLKQKLG